MGIFLYFKYAISQIHMPLWGTKARKKLTNAAKPISSILTIEAETQELFLLGKNYYYYYYSDFYIGIVRFFQ